MFAIASKRSLPSSTQESMSLSVEHSTHRPGPFWAKPAGTARAHRPPAGPARGDGARRARRRWTCRRCGWLYRRASWASCSCLATTSATCTSPSSSSSLCTRARAPRPRAGLREAGMGSDRSPGEPVRGRTHVQQQQPQRARAWWAHVCDGSSCRRVRACRHQGHREHHAALPNPCCLILLQV